MTSLINDLAYFFYMTIEVWVFFGFLVLALIIEPLVDKKRR